MDAPTLGPSWTIAALVTWWAASPWAQRIDSWPRSLRRLELHVVPALGALPCADLTAERIEHHLVQLRATLGPEALNKVRSDLRRCVRAAKAARRWPWDDPTEYVRPSRVPRRARRTLTRAEAAALLHAARLPNLALYATALYTGARKGELFDLKRDAVDLAGRRIFIRTSGRRDTPKSGDERVVPIADELVRYLARQLAAVEGRSEYVFPADDGGRRCLDGPTSRTLRSALRRAGIDAPRFRFQDLRHTTATLLRRAGVDLALIGDLLGHTSRAVTRIYAEDTFEDLLAAANRLVLGAPAPLPAKEEA